MIVREKMGKKSGPAAPAAPDPVATAQAQGQQNINSAIAQANLNRIDQVTPQGSLTYSQNGTNSDGTPRYTQTQTLSPDEQKKYDQNNQVALALNGLATDNISRVADAQSKPFTYDGMTAMKTGLNLEGIGDAGQIQKGLDYSGLTKLPGTDDFSADAQRVAGSVYSQAASRLDPQWQQNENDIKSQLAAKGISENSDAYRREYDNMSRAKTDAYNQANFSATQAGANEQSRLFGLSMSARQQGQNEVNTQGDFANGAQQQQFGQNAQVAAVNNQNESASAAFNNQTRQQEIEQAAYLRNLPLNDIASLLGTGAGVQSPDFNPVSQVGVAAPDYMGQVNSNYAQAMSQYNSKQASRSQMLGSIFGAAGTAATMMSDRRFKENVRRIGTLANGLATYAYNYIGDKVQQFGVMAQEVLGVIPGAVVRDADGYMYVDYGKVY